MCSDHWRSYAERVLCGSRRSLDGRHEYDAGGAQRPDLVGAVVFGFEFGERIVGRRNDVTVEGAGSAHSMALSRLILMFVRDEMSSRERPSLRRASASCSAAVIPP